MIFYHDKKSMIKKCANNVDNSFLLRKLFFTQYYLEQKKKQKEHINHKKPVV
jgi:hypothetical protein